MSVRRALLEPPSDAHGAAWVLALLMVAGGLYTVLISLAVPELAGGELTEAVTMAALLATAGAATLRWHRRVPARWWILVPFLAAGFIVTSNLATSDATTGSQLFMLWPVLYAAMYLNVVQTVAVLAVSLTGEAVMVLTILPGWNGVTDVASMTVVALMTAVVILQLRRRAAVLMRALEAQAVEDQLTGLPNRRGMETAMTAAIARHGREGEPVSLLTLDVDRFKAINDRLGHGGGDDALREVAACLRGCLRAVDTVARLGGDEFVVLLPGCGRDTAVTVAEEIRAAIAAGPSGLTVSIGAATIPDDAVDAGGLFRQIDAALYAAKHGGRNRVSAAV
jgi:diguanylate cyclase (GGDEF)-like protein